MRELLPLATTFFLACSAPPPLAEPDAGRPLASARFAEAEVPFDVAGDLSVVGQLELFEANWRRGHDFGPLSGASLFFSEVSKNSMLRKVSLHAVVALPDRVVVVFFAAPDGRLTLAQGGLDLPWTSQVLDAQVTRPWVGALDAVALPDGQVAIIARQRLRPSRFYVWKPTGEVRAETLDLETDDHWSYSRCPDAWLDVARDGTLALVWGMGKRVGYMTRSPAGTWSANDPPPPLDFTTVTQPHYDVGCVNRVVFDGSGFPQVLTLVRRYPIAPPVAAEPFSRELVGPLPAGFNDQGFLPTNLLAESVPELSTLGYAKRADGLWYRGGPSETLPSQDFRIPSDFHSGYLALDLHPAGFVVSGTTLNPDKPVFEYKISSFVHRGGLVAKWQDDRFTFPLVTREVGPGQTETVPDYMAAADNSVGTHFAFSACGGGVLYGPGVYRDPKFKGAYQLNKTECEAERRAPLNRPEVAVDPAGFPVFAHGPRPYQVAMCLNGNRLALCWGGFPRRPVRVDEGPALVSSSPAAGQELPVAQTTVTLTLDRALLDDESLFIATGNVSQALETVSASDARGPVIEVPVPSTLEPGQVLRVALHIKRPGGDPAWVTTRAPELVVTRAGLTRFDPRVVPTEPICPGTRSATACEWSSPVAGEVGNGFELDLDYDFEARDLGMPSVWNEDGSRNRDVTVTRSRVLNNSRFTFSWTVAQPPGARRTVTFPADLVDGHGVVLQEAWRRYVVTIRP